MRQLIAFLLAPFSALFLLLGGTLDAQVPQIINYQGRVAAGGVNFNGTGQFRFALISQGGSQTYWSNDGTSSAGSAPTSAVSLPVANGLYNVGLGDATLANMTAIPASVFSNPSVYLRVWFDDGTDGAQQLSPDQRIASVGYAMIAANVPNGAISSAQIAAGAVGSAQLAANAVQSANIATGAVGSSQIANGAITATNITGVLPQANGGTGVSAATAAGVLSALGVDSELFVFAHMSYSSLYGGMWVSTSRDGVNWLDLNGGASVYSAASAIGGSSPGIGDFSPYYDAVNRIFYVAYTEGYGGAIGTECTFGIASSPDLLNWTQLTHVATGIGAVNTSICYGPIFYVDASGGVHIMVACSVDTVPHLKIYETHPASSTNLTSWSPLTQVTMPVAQGVNEMWVFRSPDDSNLHAIYIDFNNNGQWQHATATNLTGPWTQTLTLGFAGCEGGEMVRIGADANGLSRWRFYYEQSNASSAGYWYQDYNSSFLAVGSPHNIKTGLNEALNGKFIQVDTTLAGSTVGFVGSLSTEDADGVAITGGTINGVTLSSGVTGVTGPLQIGNIKIGFGANDHIDSTDGVVAIAFGTATNTWINSGNAAGCCYIGGGTPGNHGGEILQVNGNHWISGTLQIGGSVIAPVNLSGNGYNGLELGAGGAPDRIDSATGHVLIGWGTATDLTVGGNSGTGGIIIGSSPYPPVQLNNGILSVYGKSTLGTAGTGVTRVRHGTATLISGLVTVSDQNVTSSTRFSLTEHTTGTPAALAISAVSPGASFTITSSNSSDSSSVDWIELEP